MSDKITLGPYMAGEIPAPLTYTFLDADGVALDLTGYAARFTAAVKGGASVDAVATVSDPLGGEVTHVWDELTAGVWRAVLWVGNGTNRFASVEILYNVAQPPVTRPAI